MTQLMLLFRVGAERYAVDTTSVVEIIPRVELSAVPGLSDSDEKAIVAGRFNYHG
ncbi:MAG: chemotaxis protein CheW [Cyanobacteria bacterium J06621_11]